MYTKFLYLFIYGIGIGLATLECGRVVRLAVHQHPDGHAGPAARGAQLRFRIGRADLSDDVETRPRAYGRLYGRRPPQQIEELLFLAVRYVVDGLYVR